ncbi:MAG: MIP/aquaporin family protein [Rhodospirillaceae bacterium]|jgi:glycerol uptake facilitator-like aquaporin
MIPSRSKKLVAEALGTALLLATVVGSGIMADGLSGGNDGLALLANAIATGAILVVLILIFGPVSGAHFNPAVTFVFLLRKDIGALDASLYIGIQIVAALFGVMLAHAMFDLTLVQTSLKVRTGGSQWLSEGVATFGLLATILGCVRWRPGAVPYAVGLFITAGYWFTASTSFANPAVTIARSFTNTFAGILPGNVSAFIAAQLIGAALAFVIFSWLYQDEKMSQS